MNEGAPTKSPSKNNNRDDLRPSDILIERFGAWKALVKQLITYFEGVADVHSSTAKELAKLRAVIQVPFRAGHHFLGEGGLQDIYSDIRDKTRVVADEHANLGRTIDSSIVQHLQKLRSEIKAHVKNIQNDTGKLATNVAKERELSTRLITDLSANISSFKSTPMAVTSKTDPYVVNAAVIHQLTKQVHEENQLRKSILAMQQNSANFEETIVRAIQSAWQRYNEWQGHTDAAIAGAHSAVSAHVARLPPDHEWTAFRARHPSHLLDPATPARDPAAVVSPHRADPSVAPVRTGLLERKKRFTRAYRESFFVLTPAGFLHEYASAEDRDPLFSLFLPMCTLGPPTAPTAASHKFHIEGRKDGTTTGGTIRRSLRLGRGEHAWSFRARSREDMMGWWDDMSALCARHLVASDHGEERRGPVAAAVRAAGYHSEETDGAGSSGEDELEYADAEGGPPSYTHDMEMDKKARDPSTDAGAGVGRRPSRRQQEKGAEGHFPHAGEARPPHDAAVPDHHADPPASNGAQPEEEKMPGGSRFMENV
ncbi:hypothetical protein GGX14DRAFT_473834 [Mycena pura]|uniref:PH domain-containing protein n=1 Tax=Mycena pura TaxID=153505 RepID=A0AAD6Y6B5_9AGAR|nr:hypothetical protein GGX14DRAFT_473834 [Mycena pura]